MKKIVIAVDSFKGSASSSEAAEYLSRGLIQANQSVEVTKVPLADGGEGTVTAILSATDGKSMTTKVSGPVGGQMDAKWGLIDDQTAVIEMAAAAGFTQDKNRDVALKSTYGVGELIQTAIDHGVTKIYLGLGGSSTNDGGVGMAQALGGHFLDQNGAEIPQGIDGLGHLAKIDLTGLQERLRQVQVIGLSDVDNPLTGETGATQVFGPQKGVGPDQIGLFDHRLHRLADLTASSLGDDFSNVPGAGAAGGLGFGVLAFLGGRLTSGINAIIHIVGLQTIIQDADLVITGEGQIDRQTLNGKLPMGVLKVAQQAKVPIIAVAGSVSDHVQPLYEQGFDLIVSTTTRPMSVSDAISAAPELITQTGYRLGKMLLFGKN
ncbi:glycerate kinase family protein [Lentilactobacillus otakiensis]|uniref:glycerate kinase family protein n=1 Tax=Lentilactobacillus otakiensis TaxID=481720 RepID=UPI003D1629A3